MLDIFQMRRRTRRGKLQETVDKKKWKGSGCGDVERGRENGRVRGVEAGYDGMSGVRVEAIEGVSGAGRRPEGRCCSPWRGIRLSRS